MRSSEPVSYTHLDVYKRQISHLAALVSPYHSVLYHSVLPMRSVVWGTLIDLAAGSLLAALLFCYLQKSPTLSLIHI